LNSEDFEIKANNNAAKPPLKNVSPLIKIPKKLKVEESKTNKLTTTTKNITNLALRT
jgi:hypothetical protein